MYRWGSLKYYDVSELTELPVIGIVYVFRVRRHCWAEERPQDNICIREQNVRENTKSALGWTGLTEFKPRVSKNPRTNADGLNIKLPHSKPSLECPEDAGLIRQAMKGVSSVQAAFKSEWVMVSPIAI
jgi:hypothetical protein